MRCRTICALLLALMTATFTATAETNAVVTLAAERTNILPQTNTLYRLAPPILYKAPDPGPKLSTTSLAWALANEFVFRTGLKDRCNLPSRSAQPQEGGTTVFFESKNGGNQLRVFVAIEQTIEFKEWPNRQDSWESEL